MAGQIFPISERFCLAAPSLVLSVTMVPSPTDMYGLVTKIKADPEQRLGLLITGGMVTGLKKDSVCLDKVEVGDQLIRIDPGKHRIG